MKVGIKLKLVLLVTVFFLAGTLLIGGYAVYSVHTNVIRTSHEKLHSDLKLGKAYMDLKYPGSWEIRDNKLYKGNQEINNDFHVVDEVAEATGDSVTIFQGNTRVSTNVKQADGSRAVGTPAAEEIANQVLKEGLPYIGEANVVGTMNQAAYDPILNEKNEIIGMWYVGVPNTPYDLITSHIKSNIMTFIIIEILAAILLLWVVIDRNVRPLIRINQLANLIAKGDLSVKPLKIRSKDEIGQLSESINLMLHNLHALITKINGTSQHVSAASEELTASAEQSVTATNQVAAAIGEVADGASSQMLDTQKSVQALEELNRHIQKIEATTVDVLNSSTESANQAEQGNSAISDALSQMDNIQASVGQTVEVVNRLGERSNEISQVAALINSIASQTNLLALNASIEAARAGEHGSGFAVVANEVRKLAEQTANSALAVADLIHAVQRDSESTASAMSQVNQEVQTGLQKVNHAGQSFTRILHGARQVSEQVNELTGITHQMSAQSIQVTSIIENMTVISEETAKHSQQVSATSQEQLATMEEITSSAESLSNMAIELQEQIMLFKLSSDKTNG